MKKRAAMRDQIPLRRPLFGVEPSGHNLISNRCASFEEQQITDIFIDLLVRNGVPVVKNPDTRTHAIAPLQAIFE